MKQIKTGLGYDDILIVPCYSNIESRLHPKLNTSLAKDVPLEIGIIPANMDTTATPEMRDVCKKNKCGFIHHRFVSLEDVEEQEFVTLGIRGFGNKDWDDRLNGLIEIGANITVDIAHAHAKQIQQAVERIKSKKCKIIVGNVATAAAVRDFGNAGVDGIKVGIGAGESCTTRLKTGIGVPQFTAILECAEEANRFKIPIIADGGISREDHFCKAIAAGASSVMMGALFAGSDEAGGDWYLEDRGKLTKITINLESLKIDCPDKLVRQYHGQSSQFFQEKYFGMVKVGIVPEGEIRYIPYSGSAQNIIDNFSGGLRSSMSYLGAKIIKEYQNKAEFITTSKIKA